jgi:hypothetical protein
VLNRHIRELSKLGLVAAAMGLTASSRQEIKPFMVYHDGANILFAPEITGSQRHARFGPWDLGERLSASDEKPRDKRLNLYVVLPGEQYRSPAHHEYDHNLVVNKYTLDGKPREWDVFWCLALDRSLPANLRSEHDLLMAAHQTFHPGESYQFQDVPAAAVVSEKLSVTSVEGLRRFRRKDGSLPRLLIIPAHFALRATATREIHETGVPSAQ